MTYVRLLSVFVWLAERASVADLGKVPGVSAESARKIFEYFHAQPS